MKGISYGIRNSPTQRTFWDRFVMVAEDRLGIKRYDRGFMRAIKIALDLPADSTPQRWFEGGLPRLPYILRIYERWHVTPNYLLGIEEEAHTPPLTQKIASVEYEKKLIKILKIHAKDVKVKMDDLQAGLLGSVIASWIDERFHCYQKP